MKKFLAVALAIIMAFCLFCACGGSQTDTVDEKKEVFATVCTDFPVIDETLITEDEYQFIKLDDTTFVYKVTSVLSQRSNIVTPTNGSVTVQLSLTNDNTKAKKYTIALWETDGSYMQYTATCYATVDENCYSYTFEGLDTAKSYRAIVSVDRGYATGYIALKGAPLFTGGANDADIENDETV